MGPLLPQPPKPLARPRAWPTGHPQPNHHSPLNAATREQDKDTITCFVLSSISEKVLENFNSTGRVSFFVGLPSHEAYQFKGEFIDTRSLTDDELSHSEKFRNNCIKCKF